MSDNIDWNAEDYKTQGYIVSKEGRKKRIDICNNCDNLNSLKICSKCNCFMPVKVWAKFVDCPIKKWTREEE